VQAGDQDEGYAYGDGVGVEQGVGDAADPGFEQAG